MKSLFACLGPLLGFVQQTALAEVPDTWITPLDPFQIADELFYVGSQDLASYLVVTPGGNILINANLASSPPQIRASIEKLGFRWTDIRILLTSQAHSDHMGGAAAVIRETRARNMVMDGDVSVVESGGKADFTAPSPPGKTLFTPTRVDRILHNGDTVSLGGITLTAHKTAGHTRGTTTWTMQAHLPGDPADRLRDVVIVGGTGFWSAYRFVDGPGHPASYPGIAEDFKDTFAALRALPCDVFLGAHGGYFDLHAKLQRYPEAGPRVFLDPEGYRRYVNDSEEAFEAAFLKQRTATASNRPGD
jgi:metallo-beta-lactamase class B